MQVKPNNSNLHQVYLELYQKNNLSNFLPYFTIYCDDIINRINASMKTMSKELLNIYHNTRKKSNPELHASLGENYKKALYELHGKYIESIKNNQTPHNLNNSGNSNNSGNFSNLKNPGTSISLHSVYQYMKELQPPRLRQLFYERMILINKNIALEYFSKNCIYTMTQSKLMFEDNE